MRPLLLAAASAVFVTGCGGGGGGSADEVSATTPVPSASDAAAARDPGEVLTDFVEAAGTGDAEKMWSLLSRRTQTRIGSTLAKFRGGPAHELEEGVGSFAGGGYELILAERITEKWAVAALAGERTAEGAKEYAAYAAALRLEGRAWRLELGDSVRIRPLRPDPGEVLEERTQLAAEIKARAPIVEGGLWLDGQAVPGESGGVSDRYLTIYTDIVSLEPGPHSIVVFASAGHTASARAWTFKARPNPRA